MPRDSSFAVLLSKCFVWHRRLSDDKMPFLPLLAAPLKSVFG